MTDWYSRAREDDGRTDDEIMGEIEYRKPDDAQYVTLDEKTNRMRPMTDDEIAELRAKVRVTPVQSPLDTPDESAYDPHIGSMIDTEVGE